MENPAAVAKRDNHGDLINTFSEITSSTKKEAQFFLESHNFDLDAAVSTFYESTTAPPVAPNTSATANPDPDFSPSSSPLSSPSRSRSPSPTRPLRPQPSPYGLRSRQQQQPQPMPNKKPSGSRAGGIRTLSDLNNRQDGSDSDDDNPQEYYTGGEKSGMLVQGPPKANDVDNLFNQARQAGGVEAPVDHLRSSSSSRNFTGAARLLSGETRSATPQQPPEVVNYTITFWSNGFTVNDGPLRRLDDPANASFLESIRRSECPKELEPSDKRTQVRCSLMRKMEEFRVTEKPQAAFQGLGRTLGSTSSSNTEEPTAELNTAPAPAMGLVVDQTQPVTSIQLRLGDGTRMVSHFNHYHTIRDIRAFIDASRPGAPRTYQLQTVGFPPKQLTELDKTIEQAGLVNSVVIQKF